MLSEKRVIQMTRMELLYRKEGETIERFDQLDKKDYVSYRGTVTFFLGTLIYLGIYAAVVSLIFVILQVNITDLTTSLLIFGGIVGYLVFLYICLLITHFRSVHRYDAGRRLADEMQKNWEVLGELYEHDTLS